MTNLINTNFGEYIKQLRVDKGYTLTQLAAKLDLDSANLCRIENGKREFNEKKLPKLAEALDEDVDSLKVEYFGCLIANRIYKADCSNEVLSVAEKKVNYLNMIHLRK